MDMRTTGIKRTVDAVGRFVIPMELRKQLNIVDAQDELEVFVEEDRIILKKYTPSCFLCSNSEDLVEYNDHKICKACIAKLAESIAEIEAE